MKYGIDLGTTYSCIAYVDDYGKVKVIDNAEDENITPSVVKIDGDKPIIVGRTAKNAALLYPEKTIEMVKRSMGETRKDGSAKKVTVDGREFSPQIISSYILRKLVSDANKRLGVNVKSAVITVPAYFGEEARKATQEAGAEAGLTDIKIVDEPVAAAICYRYIDNDGKDKKIVVYDLGGGTFDVSLIELKGNKVDVKRHDGNKRLGGKDWDFALVDYIFDKVHEQKGMNKDELMSDSMIFQEAVSAAEEKVKKELTKRESVTFILQSVGAEITVTREKFEELTRPLLMQTVTVLNNMLRGDDFDEFLLVGGSTRMPQVRKILEEKYRKPIRSYREDEAVACGAAVYGYDAKDMKVSINSAKSFGILVATDEAVKKCSENPDYEYKPSDHEISNIVKIHTRLPADNTKQFHTTYNNQRRVLFQIFENISESDTVEYSQFSKYSAKKLSEGVLELAPNLEKGSAVIVRLKVEDAGGLFVMGTDPVSQNNVVIPIRLATALSEEEKEKNRRKFDF